jgi:hypothetical protein
MSDVTRILDRAQQGDPKATEELLPLVYDELRRGWGQFLIMATPCLPSSADTAGG